VFYIDNNKCIRCGACVDACPNQAISIQNDLIVINQRLCRQCGNCAEICPVEAISAITPVYAQSVKGGDEMRGRGWFGQGYRSWGRGNPYPFCRFYPWLPRRWWATPYAGYYAGTIPYGYPRYATYYPPYTPYW